MSSALEDSDSWIRYGFESASFQFSGWRRSYQGSSLSVNLWYMVKFYFVAVAVVVKAAFLVDSELYQESNHNLHRGLLASILKSDKTFLLPVDDERCLLFSGLACLVSVFGSYYMWSSQDINLAVESVMMMKKNSLEDMQIRLKAAVTRMVSLGIKMVGYLLPILNVLRAVGHHILVRLSEILCAFRSFEHQSVSLCAGASAESELSPDHVTSPVTVLTKTNTSGTVMKFTLLRILIILILAGNLDMYSLLVL